MIRQVNFKEFYNVSKVVFICFSRVSLRSSRIFTRCNYYRRLQIFGNESKPEYLAETYAKQITVSNRRYTSFSPKTIKLIEKYASQQAAQVKQAVEQKKASQNNSSAQRKKRSGVGSANTSSVRSINRTRTKMNQAQKNYQKEITEIVTKLSDENISAADRKNIIKEARNKILAINNDSFRSSNLIWLAMVAAKYEEIDLAQKILGEAENAISAQSVKKQDFKDHWKLVNAYAGISPDKLFALMENMIYGLNGVINAYINYNIYTGNERVFKNGELVIKSNIGNSLPFFNISIFSLKKLAEADFKRTENIADKFDRPELRIESRLRIAKALATSR